MWSLLSKGRVIDRMPALIIYGARFVVLAGGHRRAKDSGTRNVHAFVEAEENCIINPADGRLGPEAVVLDGLEWVSYRPAMGYFFLVRNGKKVISAEKVVLTASGSCWTLNPE